MKLATTQSTYLTPRFVAVLCSLVLVVLAVLYMYFLSMSVVHVVMRKELHQERREVESRIAELEASYIEAQHKVSEKIAMSESLAETNEKIFIERVTPALVLGRGN
jgi:predicted Holliday junction resolvase-like endonuclease